MIRETSIKGVAVYIRTADEAEGKHLCDVPLADLQDERVLDIIGRWGLHLPNVGVVQRDWLVGQFALTEYGAVFELIAQAPAADES